MFLPLGLKAVSKDSETDTMCSYYQSGEHEIQWTSVKKLTKYLYSSVFMSEPIT